MNPEATRQPQPGGSDDRFRAVVEAQIDPLVVLAAVRDRQHQIVDLQVVEVNHAARDRLGRTRDELVGRTFLELFPAAAGQPWWPDLVAVVETGEPRWASQVNIATMLTGPSWYRYQMVRVGDGVAIIWQDVSAEVEARLELERSEARLRSALDSDLDWHIFLESVRDEEGRITDLRVVEANQGAAQRLGMAREQAVGALLRELFGDRLDPQWWDQMIAVIETGEPLEQPEIELHSAVVGQRRWFAQRAVRLGDGLSLAWRDVTEEYQANRAEIRAANEQYRLMVDNSADVVFHSAGGIVKWVSPSATEVLGRTPAELIGHPSVQYWHPEDRAAAVRLREAAHAGQTGKGTFRWRRPDGSYVWLEAVDRPVVEPDGTPGMVGVMRDISERVAAQEELARVMKHDQLTGLATRAVMVELVGAALAARTGSCPVAVLSVSVDRLATVSDAYGQAGGDLALTTIASRIVEVVGDDGEVARASGPDFLVLVPPQVRGLGETAALAERIRAAAKEDISIGRHRVGLTVSVGIALSRGDGDPEGLVQAATLAMRRAKEAGRDRYVFDEPELAAAVQRRARLLEEVRAGLARQEFVPWFMPIVDLAGGRPRGYEALARWRRPHGPIGEPGEFLAVLESAPQIFDLDATILAQAVAEMGRAEAVDYVAVNVSARTLGTPGAASELLDVIRASSVDPARLHLEITETTLLDLSEQVLSAVRQLADAGVRWYVDDFGTGYSSISHLRDLPLAGLKLDRSFTLGVGRHDSTSTRLAQALAGMAHGLGLDTVAEGIEYPGVAAVLAAQGWRHGQGWLYGKAASQMG